MHFRTQNTKHKKVKYMNFLLEMEITRCWISGIWNQSPVLMNFSGQRNN